MLMRRLVNGIQRGALLSSLPAGHMLTHLCYNHPVHLLTCLPHGFPLVKSFSLRTVTRRFLDAATLFTALRRTRYMWLAAMMMRVFGVTLT